MPLQYQEALRQKEKSDWASSIERDAPQLGDNPTTSSLGPISQTSVKSTTQEPQTTTELLPWVDRVNSCVDVMAQLTEEIIGGAVDSAHARDLDHEATVMDGLVLEGQEDPSLLANITEEDINIDLLDSLVEDISIAEDMIDEKITDKKVCKSEIVSQSITQSLSLSHT